MATKPIHQLAAWPGNWRLRMEGLWLRFLPPLTRDYFWVEVDGFRLYGSTAHRMYLYRLLKGSFEPFKMELFKQVVKPGMVVVDIGAYIGYHTVSAARLVGPQGKVYAFECDPRNYRFLLHNIRLNNCYKVVPILKAVTHQAGVLALFLQADPSTCNLWHKPAAESTLEVEGTTLDEVLVNQWVDVIKMSIQGGEIRALQGMEQTLSRKGEIILFVECSPSTLKQAGGSVDSLLGQLERFGFRIQVIDEQEQCLKPVGEEIYAHRDARGRKNFVYLYCSKGGKD